MDTHVHGNIIHNNEKWKQAKCPLKDEWINKMWYIHMMEYYLAFKRKEILIHATTWVNLENITLSKISQTEKDKYWMVLFI